LLRSDAFDPERLVRLHEAAFNLAARLQDFTVFRNLYAADATMTRCVAGHAEIRRPIDLAVAFVPRTAVCLFHEVVAYGQTVVAQYVGTGWPGGMARGRAIFTIDDGGRVVDLRLEEGGVLAMAEAPGSTVLAERW